MIELDVIKEIFSTGSDVGIYVIWYLMFKLDKRLSVLEIKQSLQN